MKNRDISLDCLKIIATVFVVVLHFNGFVKDTFLDFSKEVNVTWHILQAISYPAIHLFVMITAWFAIEKVNSKKSIMNVWFQTIFVCLLGLTIAFFTKIPFSKKEMTRVLFPFFGRAYWYVTDYIYFVLLCPFLNIVIKNINENELKRITLILFLFISVFTWLLSPFDWNQDYSNIGLFVLLYFLTACIKKFNIPKKYGFYLWVISLITIVLSYGCMHVLFNGAYRYREMLLYQYNSPFVIMEAIGLMIMFTKTKFAPKNRINKMIELLANCSLIVYLIQMHPIFKEKYVSLGLFAWIDINNFLIYISEMFCCVLMVFVIGILLNYPLKIIFKNLYSEFIE